MSTITSTTVIGDGVPTELLVSVSELARRRGRDKALISRQVARLAADGKLHVYPGPGGRKLIDVVEFDRAIGEVSERVTARDEPQPAPSSAAGAYVPPAETGALTKAKTATEVYRARLAQLEYDERIGKLLLRDDVERAVRQCAEATAREIDLWPMRTEEIAAAFRQNGEQGLRLVLKAMARELLATLAKNMRMLADAPPAAMAPKGDVL